MSYSFTVRGATKQAASDAVAAELAKVVEAQPVHSADARQAQDTADAFIGVLRDDDRQDVVVAVNGWVSGSGAGIGSACVGVTASLQARKVELPPTQG